MHSGTCGVPGLNSFCRESYSTPESVYQHLKQMGMDLVTVTDHDSIGALESLGRHRDFFASEELTCRMPSGTVAHVGVYNIDERQHLEIQQRRDDLPRLLAYLEENRTPFCLMHPFSSLTGRRAAEDFDWFQARFSLVEVLNGHIPRRLNHQAEWLARNGRMAAAGGSDAHTVSSAGRVYTEVPGARNKQEFLQGLRSGRSRVFGESGTWWQMTRDVLRIAAAMVGEHPAKLVLAPLALAVPAATSLHWMAEQVFVRWWSRVLRGTPPPAGFSWPGESSARIDERVAP